MTIQYRGTGTSGNTGSTNVTSQVITLPTGWAAGDLLFFVFRAASTITAFSQTGGTGTWTLDFNASYAGGSFYYVAGHRRMAAGDTNPTFGWTTASNDNWSCGGFFSDSGGVLFLDKFAPGDPAENATAGTSVTPNAVTGAGGTEASIILTDARSSLGFTSTSHTYTPPSGWTFNDGDGGYASPGRAAMHCYRLGVSGTVTPGSQSLTDSAGNIFFFAVFHALVQESAVRGRQPVLPPRRAPARAYIRFTPVATVNAAPPPPVSGTVQPRAAVPVPRRAPARAVWARVTGQGLAQVPAPVQQFRVAPRRPPARAWVQFTPVRTTNAASVTPVNGTVQPLAARPAPRRTPVRAYVRFTPVSTVNAVPVAGAGRALAVDTESRLIRRYRHMLHRHGLDSWDPEVSMLSAPVAFAVPPGWPGTWPEAPRTIPDGSGQTTGQPDNEPPAPKWRPVYTRPPKIVRARQVPRDAMMPVWRK